MTHKHDKLLETKADISGSAYAGRDGQVRKREAAPFAQYRQQLSEAQGERLDAFFARFMRHCALAPAERALLREDFEAALLYFRDAGVPLDEALRRLSVDHMGGFYVRPPSAWFTLDDAAKVYPLSMKRGQMAVFRLSAYMAEPVVPELLQMALTFMIKRFPSFATTVKKGFFWHYLDAAKRRYAIETETDIPCRPLHIARSGSQAFRVLYHRNRISVEYFHILTDGTGGMLFLKTLVAEYLRLKGVAYAGKDDIGAAPALAEVANEFGRAEGEGESGGGFMDRAATQMSGRLSRIKPCQVLHFKMNAASLKEAAKSRGVTVTAYVLSRMFLAGKAATDEMEGTIRIQVPVNLRKFYPSQTVRNFSMYCGIGLRIPEIADGPALQEAISAQLAERTSKAAMSGMMRATRRMVGLLRYIPLAVKTPVAKAVYGFLGDRIFSNTLSNLGIVRMPPELAAHIESLDFVLGTAVTNRANCALVTFGNIATLSITKMTADPTFEEEMYRLLLGDGIELTVEGSPLYDR